MGKRKSHLSPKPSAFPELPIAGPTRRQGDYIAIAVLLILVLIVFGDVLFVHRYVMPSSETKDLPTLFTPLRMFGFGEMRQGNIPLWNPYLFSGIPFIGGFQSALFYPPNWIHLVLPDKIAINWLIAIHVFLSGACMYVWARGKGLSWPAGLLAGCLFMFCAPDFLRVYAGHLCITYAAPWIPLLFWSLDGYLRKRSLGSGLVGVFALSMMILAGHPQTVFYTLIAAGLYALFHLVRASGRGRLLAGWAIVFVGVAGLTAVQVLPGIDAANENVRSAGGYEYASLFSFPAENFLTFLIPGILGDDFRFPYWGRGSYLEMCLFMGVFGFVLSIYGAVRGRREQRRYLVFLAAFMLLLALGAHSPLFKLLYDYVPGFSTFRGNCKFNLQAGLFLAMLAGIGMDRLLADAADASRKRSNTFTILVVLAALVTLGVGLTVHAASVDVAANWWQAMVKAVPATGESYFDEKNYSDLEFVRKAGRFAATGMFIAAGTLTLLAGLLFASSYSGRVAHALLVLAIVEIAAFAWFNRASYDPAKKTPLVAQIEQFIKSHPGDHRILNLAENNAAMRMRAYSMWGHDPSVSLRFAEFVTHTQGGDPNSVSQYVVFSRPHRLYRMLRLKYVLFPVPEGVATEEQADPMPLLNLLTDYTIATERDQIFAIMDSPSFDPAKSVVLESQPDPVPVSSASPGSARLVDRQTDYLIIEADVTQPAILLVTNGYSKDWQAKSLPGSTQLQYELMPANYVLRAIPLSAGHHIIRLEYSPVGYRIGKWITLASLVGYLVVVAWWGLSCYRRNWRNQSFELHLNP